MPLRRGESDSHLAKVWESGYLRQMINLLAAALMLSLQGQDPNVAVLDTLVEGTDPAIGPQISERLATLISELDGRQAMSPEVLRSVLQNEANRELGGCDDSGCLSELAAALGAQEVVSCRVAFLDGACAITLTRSDASKAQAIKRVNEVWRGESLRLLNLLKPMVDALYEVNTKRGAIVFEGLLEGTQISIDGQVRGTAPAGQIGDLAMGSHRVTLTQSSVDDEVIDFIITDDKALVLSVTQKEAEQSVLGTWWFWTAAGTTTLALAAGAVGGAILLTSQNSGKTGIGVGVNSDSAFSGAQ